MKVLVESKKIPYQWSLIPWFIFTLLAEFQLLFALYLFIVWTILWIWTIFWINLIKNKKARNILLIVLVCISPIVFFGIFIWWLLWAIWILILAWLPLLVVLPIASWILIDPEKTKKRLIIFACIVAIAILFFILINIKNFI